jgi:hypothetical protein
MRKRRLDAKTRVAARTFLAGAVGAVETCVFLRKQLYQDPNLLSVADKNFLERVATETRSLPIGNLKDNWHPDFLPAKLAEVEKYDSRFSKETTLICERVLEAMKLRNEQVETK